MLFLYFLFRKAYGTVWKHGVAKDMFNAGLRGHMPIFIQKFLSNRVFRVYLG